MSSYAGVQMQLHFGEEIGHREYDPTARLHVAPVSAFAAVVLRNEQWSRRDESLNG